MGTTPSLRDKHAKRTRERIVAEAIALFVEKGFDATTVDEIAAKAEVSARTLFRYFPTKDALIYHDLEARLDDISTWLGERPTDEPAVASLIEVLCTLVDDIESSPERRALLVRVQTERPSLRSYQRTTIIEHTEAQVVATLATRAGLPEDDLGMRALVAIVASCFDVAMRDWVAAGATGSFRDLLRATVHAGVSAAGATTD